MRVLVTGAGGRVATAVIEDLERDHDLVLLARRPPAAGSTRSRAPLIVGDLTVLDDCRRAVRGVEAIAHLGASNWSSPDTFRNNVLGTYHLLEAAREAGVRRVVLASSACVLGHCGRRSGPFVPEVLPIDETYPSAVEDSYGLSKLLNEQTLASFARAHRIEGIGLRLAWCWGPAERARRVQQPYEASHGAGSLWAYVDMRDVVQAFRLALHAPWPERPAEHGYYISAADSTADEPSAELIARFHPHLAHLAPRLPGHASFFDGSAARRAFGYAPRFSWRDDVR